MTDFTSLHLSRIDMWCTLIAKPNVAFLEVSPTDENGFMSYGASGVVINKYVKEVACNIVLQVNPQAPYVYGQDNLIHVSEASIIVEADDELEEIIYCSNIQLA